MTPDDLDLRELLEFSPHGGVIRFAGQRALILDAVALGLLRGELIRTVGLTGARAILTRFGYAHGVRTAQAMKDAFPWDSEREWRIAGGRLHSLQGLMVIEPVRRPRASAPFAESFWHESYEAEQHLLFVGLAEEPVCWSLCGFASGYLSHVNGREIYCVEERCVGKGDAACHVVGRSREEWGDAITPHLQFYAQCTLATSLEQVTRALKETEARLRSRRRALAPDEDHRVSGLVTRSPAMKQAVELARRAAKVDSTVLITGPTGVGKKRLARLVHDQSARAAGPFVSVSCAAASEGLLESELFGQARGAFKGTSQDRPGLLEAVNGGTLYLDEVGELSLKLQLKLLRVLQEREVRRVGEDVGRPVDFRLLAGTTNPSLADEVAARRFRQDLYYRLRVVELRVPPLTARREDVVPLARELVAEVAQEMGRPVKGFTVRAIEQLQRHGWPGNVRELRNAVEQALALAQGERIDLEDLPEEVRGSTAPKGSSRLEDVERAHILAVLEQHGGNRAVAAQALGIGPATLYRKLRQYRSARPRRR